MKKLLKTGGSLLVLAICAGVVATPPAAAQSAAQIQSIQKQIQQLQQQLQQLKADSTARDAELQKARADAAAARRAATPAPPAAPVGSVAVTIPPNDKDAAGQPVFNPHKPNGRFNIGGVTVQLGGFVDMLGIYRTRNQNTGASTSFAGGIPYGNSPNYRTGELRGTSQLSRVSLLVSGSPYDGATIAAYGEGDFNAAAATSNSVQTNSYAFRIRQAYVQFDDNDMDLHVLGGQAWSLLTPFKSGLTPRAENTPPLMDDSIIQGFARARQPQIRVGTEFGKSVFLAASLEAPQTTFAGSKPTIAGESITSSSVAFGGTTGVAGTVAGGGLNPLTAYSYNTAPDIIVKAAFEPGFGHYELFGIARFLEDQKVNTNGGGSLSTLGGGLGASAFLSFAGGKIDLSGNVLAGYGLGRYGNASLPDATYKADGSPQPLPTIMGMLGVVGHATPKLDLFAFGGIEHVDAKSGTGIGYGNSALIDNSGCNAITATTAGTCSALTKSSEGLQVGGWYKVFQGGAGTLMAGASYQYDRREIFDGKGGAPTTDENVFFVDLRYLPFQ